MMDEMETWCHRVMMARSLRDKMPNIDIVEMPAHNTIAVLHMDGEKVASLQRINNVSRLNDEVFLGELNKAVRSR